MQVRNLRISAVEGGVQHAWSRYPNIPKDPGFFPIGVWAQDPTDAGRYEELGVNYYFGLHGGPTATQMAGLREHGMATICHLNKYARENLLNEPLVWGWMHHDEPDLAHVYPRAKLKAPGGKQIIKEHWPEVYEKLDLDKNEYNGWGMGAHPVIDVQADYKRWRETDPLDRPVFLQLSQSVAYEGKRMGRGDHSGNVEVYPGYFRGADVISFDVYPVARGKPDKLWLVAKGLDQLREWGSGDKSLMLIAEAGCGDKTRANRHQQRAEVWMAINHGATSICWFCHRFVKVDGKIKLASTCMPLVDADVGAAVKAINTELHKMASVINCPPLTDAVTATGGEIDLGARRKDGAVYIFAVERGNADAQGELTVAGVKDATVEVIGEDRTLTCKNGVFSDSFKPFDTHLYKVGP